MSRTKKWVPKKKGKIIPFKRKHPKKASHVKKSSSGTYVEYSGYNYRPPAFHV